MLLILSFLSLCLSEVGLSLALSQVVVLLFVGWREGAPALARLLQEGSLLETLQLCLQLGTNLRNKEREACLRLLHTRGLLKGRLLFKLLVVPWKLELLLLNFLEVQVIFRHLIKFRLRPVFSSN